jgi:hypothetical protein
MMLLVLTIVTVVVVIALLVALRRREEAAREAGLPGGTRVAAADLGASAGLRELRGLTLRDDEWGLVGRPDLLLESPQGPIPDEVKRASKGWRAGQSYRSHRLQMGTYFLLCEADPRVGRRPPDGRIRYVGPDGRTLPGGDVRVANTEALREDVLQTVRLMRGHLRAPEVHRSHAFPSRCRGCGVRAGCGEALV